MRERVVSMPWPPTVNHKHIVRGKRLILSPVYRRWMVKAEIHLLTLERQPGESLEAFTGPVEAWIYLEPPARRPFTNKDPRKKGWDKDNRTKPVLDALVRAGVVEDDDIVWPQHVIPEPAQGQGQVRVRLVGI